MAIVLNGTGTVTGITGITGTNATVTGITSVASNAANTPVILQDSGSNTNTCRAWVNFNGSGTVAIRASFNVSSITDNGTGDYTVNFTTAMPDSNYAAFVSKQTSGTVNGADQVISQTTTALQIRFRNGITTSVLLDPDSVYVSSFR
jgi:hypothetical protein